MAEQMSQRGMGLMTCCLGADISEADRKRPRKTTLVTCEKRKNKMNVAGGDIGEGGVGTDMAEETREILRKLGERNSTKTKTTGKTTVQREKRSGSE